MGIRVFWQRRWERVGSRQLECTIPGRSQGYALMLTHCCVTRGMAFIFSGSSCPYGNQISQHAYGPAGRAAPFLLVCFGVTFLLEDQEWGIGQCRPLSQTRGLRLPGDKGCAFFRSSLQQPPSSQSTCILSAQAVCFSWTPSLGCPQAPL